MNTHTPEPTTESQSAEVMAATNFPTPISPLVDLDAVRAQAKAEARAEALSYVAEVNDLCQLAGMPDKAAAFIAKAVPTAEVRNALLTAKAAASEATAIVGQLSNNETAVSAETKIDTAAIYAKRNNKKGN